MDFARARNEDRRQYMQLQAAVEFHSNSMMAKMISGTKGQKITIMDEFSFLWTDEEIKQAKRDAYLREMEARVQRDKTKREGGE